MSWSYICHPVCSYRSAVRSLRHFAMQYTEPLHFDNNVYHVLLEELLKEAERSISERTACT